MHDIERYQAQLAQHPLYSEINSLERLRTFMEAHVFAVWDFMSLLKGLQQKLTCIEVPWRPAPFDRRLTRLINEIVMGEESDLDLAGRPIDHFTLYLESMREVGADTTPIETFIRELDFSQLPKNVADFTRMNLNLALEGELHEVAAAFFFGREKLIPEMFTGLLQELEAKGLRCPSLLYYIKRHIELDGEEHGEMAGECLELLTEGHPERINQALRAGLESLKHRQLVWDEVLMSYKCENRTPSDNH